MDVPLRNIFESYFRTQVNMRGSIKNNLREIFSQQVLDIIVDETEKYGERNTVVGKNPDETKLTKLGKYLRISEHVYAIYIGILDFLVAESNNALGYY